MSDNTFRLYMSGKPVILWRGKSELDSSREAVAVLRRTTTNRKTGPCHQLTIFDPGPVDKDTKHFGAGCVKCPARSSCYVTGPQKWGLEDNHKELDSVPVVPRSQWPKYIYDQIRFGEYGDPAALPDSALKAIVKPSRGHFGYTHFFRQRPGLAGLLQASCETMADVADARALGFRVYYVVRIQGSPIHSRTNEDDQADTVTLRRYMASQKLTKMVVCPYYSRGKSCIECKLCDGRKSDIIAPAHGSRANNHLGDWIDSASLAVIKGGAK